MYRRANLVDVDQNRLFDFLYEELGKVQESFNQTEFLKLKTWTSEPPKVFDGLTVMADGSDWNPGSGQGVYTYYGAAWHKLG